MVLEGGLYLTAVEIAQMRHVPDLVFLNCCHLAKMGPEAKDTHSVEYNKLAASLSRELIEMGVRAVVAAGWGVKEIVALDLGEAVDVAFDHTRLMPNAHVVQGDLLHAPVPRIFGEYGALRRRCRQHR